MQTTQTRTWPVPDFVLREKGGLGRALILTFQDESLPHAPVDESGSLVRSSVVYPGGNKTIQALAVQEDELPIEGEWMDEYAATDGFAIYMRDLTQQLFQDGAVLDVEWANVGAPSPLIRRRVMIVQKSFKYYHTGRIGYTLKLEHVEYPDRKESVTKPQRQQFQPSRILDAAQWMNSIQTCIGHYPAAGSGSWLNDLNSLAASLQGYINDGTGLLNGIMQQGKDWSTLGARLKGIYQNTISTCHDLLYQAYGAGQSSYANLCYPPSGDNQIAMSWWSFDLCTAVQGLQSTSISGFEELLAMLEQETEQTYAVKLGQTVYDVAADPATYGDWTQGPAIMRHNGLMSPRLDGVTLLKIPKVKQ